MTFHQSSFVEPPERNHHPDRLPLDITAPDFDPNTDKSKTAADLMVEQQWRDVAKDGVGHYNPLSISRGVADRSDDPYA